MNNSVRRDTEVSNVVHVVTSLGFGGVERHMEIIATESRQRPLRHEFIAISAGGAAQTRMERAGAVVVCLNKRAAIPSLSTIFSLACFFLRTRPHVVHAHGAEANFHGLIAACIARVPVRVAEEIGIPSHSRKAKLGFRLIYGCAQKVIGVSEAVSRWLVENGEVPLTKSITLYNPVKLPVVKRVSTQTDDVLRMGFVGRLEPVKNPVALIRGVAILKHRGIQCELHLVGEGSQRRLIESEISKLGIEREVRLHGYQTQPAKIIAQCDLYVQPSLSEGFGIAVVEAMAAGIPAISSKVGGVPEIIEDGRTGWLIDNSSPVSIADAVEKAWKYGPARLRKIGRSAKASVDARFAPAAYLERLESLYSKIAEEA